MARWEVPLQTGEPAEPAYPSKPTPESLGDDVFVTRHGARIDKEVEALAREGKTLSSVTEAQYDQYIALQQGKRGVYRTLKRVYNATLGWC